MVSNAGENVGEPRLGIDVVHLGRLCRAPNYAEPRLARQADGIMRARSRMPIGEGETHCLECGDEIPEARRRVVLGVRTCIGCQSERDRHPVHVGFNRRGSKDSQLK